MHVVHLEAGQNLYGGARQVLHLMQGLEQAGIDNTLVCPPDGAIAAAASHLGLKVQTMSMAGDLDAGFGRRLARWLGVTRPDLVHVHSRRGADIWGGLAARQARVPAVMSRRVDSPDLPILGKIKYRMYRRVVAISDGIAAQLINGGLSPDKLRVVHSAVDNSAQPQWLEDQFRAAFSLQKDDLVVACVAQLILRKGHATLLDAWPGIRAQCPRARLILFGKGSEESRLRAQAQRLGLDEAVIFAGFREDLGEFLAHVDVLVHPALREGLGICLLEAQAAGVPVVASSVGGIPEAVADGLSGKLVPPGKPHQLEAAVIELLNNPARRAALGAAGKEFVAENYSVERMVSGNLAVYEEVLNQ